MAVPIPTDERHAMADKAIRTTITPGEVITVDERTFVDLERQGLILSHEGLDDWAAEVAVLADVADVVPATDPAPEAGTKKRGA